MLFALYFEAASEKIIAKTEYLNAKRVIGAKSIAMASAPAPVTPFLTAPAQRTLMYNVLDLIRVPEIPLFAVAPVTAASFVRPARAVLI